MAEVRFAFVIDGEFAGSFEVNDAHPNFEHLCAVMRSGPQIVEIPETDPDFTNIKIGWIYDNGDWVAPAE